MSSGLLLARIILGLSIGAHGAQKLFGWFGGHGLRGTVGMTESLGFRPPHFFARALGTTEITAGVLMTLGLLGPLGPMLTIMVMIMAMVTVHWRNGFFGATNGIELPLFLATGAFLLAISGPGIYSLDGAFGWLDLSTPETGYLAALIAGLLALINLALRRPSHAQDRQLSGARPTR